MAKLTSAQFTTAVALACRNMPSSDPFYSSITAAVTQARNKIIRWAIGPKVNIDLFPELQNSWTVGPLTSGSNIAPKPSDAIVIYELLSAQQDSVANPPGPDWSVSRGFPMFYKDKLVFDLLPKTSATTGWPKIWTRKGNSILVWPTPSTSYLDTLHMFGIASDSLTQTGNTFYSDEYWDDATIRLAASILHERRGWYQSAQSLREGVLRDLGMEADLQGLEDIARDEPITVEGMPSRASIYAR